jgi:hypothetical protein
LVGIPRVAALRARFPDLRIWPFETGRTVPTDARVVVAEVYPSMFHRRRHHAARPAEVHDRLQVEATARAFAEQDERGALRGWFEAPPDDPSVLHEEGWVLGVVSDRAP